jgi:hypothetical protein
MRINLETAKLAKEKGYDESCSSVFVDGIPKDLGGIQRKNSTYQNQITRPIQSDLQKWLREVHEIHIDIQEWEFTNWYFYIKDGRTSPVKSIRLEIDEDTKWEFDSYEEALEIGLQEALKLIEDESRS